MALILEQSSRRTSRYAFVELVSVICLWTNFFSFSIDLKSENCFIKTEHLSRHSVSTCTHCAGSNHMEGSDRTLEWLLIPSSRKWERSFYEDDLGSFASYIQYYVQISCFVGLKQFINMLGLDNRWLIWILVLQLLLVSDAKSRLGKDCGSVHKRIDIPKNASSIRDARG